ncbi:MAG: hemolysin family protein [Planctomycetota bacterium]|jgi:putative hemolysin
MAPSDTPLLILLPVLLIASAFFSGTETALFGLSQRERASIRRKGGLAAIAVDALLRNPRRLLVSILLGNMTINVLYFVVSSVLVLHATDATWRVVFSIVPLLAIILLGEVLPKMAATSRRDVWCRFASSPMLALHRVLVFVAQPLEWLVLEPASRLVRPIGQREDPMSVKELGALLELSQRTGDIDAEEARLLDAVADLGVLRVSDAMTPRVRMAWVDENATREQLLDAFPTLPRIVHTCDGSLDNGVTGVLSVKRLLVEPEGTTCADLHLDPLYVPETATLDRLLEMLRGSHRRASVVVDEFGAVAGVITITDVVDRLVQSLDQAHADTPEDAPGVETIDANHWRVSGSLNAHDWMDAFAMDGHARAATVSGLIASALGRLPRVGDEVRIGDALVRVETMQGSVVGTLIVSLADRGAP